jgi:hypothetical protein
MLYYPYKGYTHPRPLNNVIVYDFLHDWLTHSLTVWYAYLCLLGQGIAFTLTLPADCRLRGRRSLLIIKHTHCGPEVRLDGTYGYANPSSACTYILSVSSDPFHCSNFRRRKTLLMRGLDPCLRWLRGSRIGEREYAMQ